MQESIQDISPIDDRSNNLIESSSSPSGEVDKPSLLEIYSSGLVLPAFSPTFYQKAALRSPITAIGFFLLFMLIITILQAIFVFVVFARLSARIDEYNKSGEFPEITISGGKATIHTTEPFVVDFKGDKGSGIFILDTTGEYSIEDLLSGDYTNVFLLTKTQVISYDGTGDPRPVKRIELSDINIFFGDPIEIDSDYIKGKLKNLSIVTSGFSFFVLLFWNMVMQLAFLAILAVPIWGGTEFMKKNTPFGLVLSLGFYALVPATFIHFLLDQIHIKFCGLRTLLLFIFWIFGLISALGEPTGGLLHGKRSLRSWRALIGIPMLLLLVVKLFNPIMLNAYVVWLVTMFTYTFLILDSLVSAVRSEKTQSEPRIT